MANTHAAAPVQVHLKNGSILNAKSFDKRSNDAVTAFVGMNDEIMVVVKTEIMALIMEPNAAKEYFGK